MGDQAGRNGDCGIQGDEDDGGSDPMLDDDADDVQDGDEHDLCADSPAAFEGGEGPEGDADDADGGEGGVHGASAEDLRQAWEDAKESARILESNPRSPPNLVAAARRERDRAEASWRAARQPHPLQKRLRWAQRAYDAAANKQRVHQEELELFEEESAKRRRFLLDRAQADRLRTSKKLRALEALLDQGGEQRHHLASEQAARIAAKGIATDLGPALAAAADKVAEGSPVWVELQAAMATLANVEDVLRRAVPEAQDAVDGMQPAQPTQYDISGEPTIGDNIGGGYGMGGNVHEGTGAAAGGLPTLASTTCSMATTSSTDSPPRDASTPPPRWVGPQPGSNSWGGRQWRRQDRVVPSGAAASAQTGGATVSSSQAKEQAEKLLAEQKASLEAAQARERQLAEEARLQAAEVARLQQLQLAQQAAETARLEEERRQLLARSLPEDLRRAQEVHAQQTAIIQQQQQQLAMHQQGLLQGQMDSQRAGERGVDADAERLMAMSDEELERWNTEAQQGNW